LSELDDLKRIESRSYDGGAGLIPEFYSFVETDKKYEEVVREVSALRPTLPPESEITIQRVNPGLVNVVQFALVSPDAPYPELEQYARDLKDTLKTVNGVRNAQTWAYPLASCALRSICREWRSCGSRRAACCRRCRARTRASPAARSTSTAAASASRLPAATQHSTRSATQSSP
jgi:hypothetical protein